MKSIDLFCTSQASTAICSSTDQRAMVRHGTRPIDHHINDRKKPKNIHIINPCSSQPPINPKPYYQKSRKSASASISDSTKQISDRQLIRRKSSADINDSTSATPHGSSRYLLSDKPFIDLLPETDNLSALVVSQPVMPRSLSSNDSLIISNNNSKLAASQSLRSRRQMISSNDSLVLKSSSTRSRARYQVVELMVSIHCKGCEGKVRKHISRMEGVTSFSIDRETKKVTVIGNVTPLGVLSSISRVKNAQFWPSPSSSSSSST